MAVYPKASKVYPREEDIVYTQLEDNTIQFYVYVPIIMDATGVSVAADAVGTQPFDHTVFKIAAADLRHVIDASCVIDYAWATAADGYIEVWDDTAGQVVGQSSAKTVGESSYESFEVDVTKLVALNTMFMRANITTAGGAGETVTLYRAYLSLRMGIS